MEMTVSLKNLVTRIEITKDQIKKHPEKKEMLERFLNKHEKNLIECVLKNKDNSLLEKIMM